MLWSKLRLYSCSWSNYNIFKFICSAQLHMYVNEIQLIWRICYSINYYHSFLLSCELSQFVNWIQDYHNYYSGWLLVIDTRLSCACWSWNIKQLLVILSVKDSVHRVWWWSIWCQWCLIWLCGIHDMIGGRVLASCIHPSPWIADTAVTPYMACLVGVVMATGMDTVDCTNNE